MSELPLKDFIVSTLTNICDAVEEVRKTKKYVAFQHTGDVNAAKTTLIEFDLQVTIGESQATTGKVAGDIKAGIKVLGASLKGDITSTDDKSTTAQNRIKFNIPVDFRLDETKYRDPNESSGITITRR